VERLCRGTSSWRRLAERRWRRDATSEIGVQQSVRYEGALPCRRQLYTIVASLYFTHSGTSSQLRLTCKAKDIKHPVPDRVKPSLVRAQGWASECPDVKNYKWRHNPVWHRMLYSCTTYGNSGRRRVNDGMVQTLIIIRLSPTSTWSCVTVSVELLQYSHFV